MDFTEDAMRAADTAVKRLRQRMAEWAEASPGGEGRELTSAADGGKLDGAGGREESGVAVDGGAPIPSAEARDLDGRFRKAVGNDLDMPAALVVVNEAASAAIPAREKYALLASWDAVLGLDLERRARQSWAPSEEVRALVAERDRARSARDYAKSDELRERLLAMGLEVMDAPEGTRVRPRM